MVADRGSMKKLTSLIGPLLLLVLMTVPAFAALGAVASLSGSLAVARQVLGAAQSVQPGVGSSGQIQGACLAAGRPAIGGHLTGAGRGQANPGCNIHAGAARPTPAPESEPSASGHGQSGINHRQHAAAAGTGANQPGKHTGA